MSVSPAYSLWLKDSTDVDEKPHPGVFVRECSHVALAELPYDMTLPENRGAVKVGGMIVCRLGAASHHMSRLHFHNSAVPLLPNQLFCTTIFFWAKASKPPSACTYSSCSSSFPCKQNLMFRLCERRLGAAAQSVPDAEHHGLPLHCCTAAPPRCHSRQWGDCKRPRGLSHPAGQAGLPFLQPARHTRLPALQKKVGC